MMNDEIRISKSQYLILLIDQEKLARLEGGGVDNWEGYDDCLGPDDYSGETFRMSKERIAREVRAMLCAT